VRAPERERPVETIERRRGRRLRRYRDVERRLAGDVGLLFRVFEDRTEIEALHADLLAGKSKIRRCEIRRDLTAEDADLGGDVEIHQEPIERSGGLCR
jgi:hypothetical protein